jgi:hypothetical protein
MRFAHYQGTAGTIGRPFFMSPAAYYMHIAQFALLAITQLCGKI